MTVASKTRSKVADEVWIVVALLHREHPAQSDFSIEEIMERANKESGKEPLRPGFYVHVIQHCVANRPPNPGRYRMLFETAPGRRRLFRPGDPYHPEREGGKMSPKPEDLTENRLKGLLSWYDRWYRETATRAKEDDPLLALYGTGKNLWADEHADEYVRRLREGWE